MRIKIRAKRFGVDELQLGEWYVMGYEGTKSVDLFQFSRKDQVILFGCISGVGIKQRRGSKKDLKREIRDGTVRFLYPC
ncbi:hypothetical protein IMZ31_23605 (plasmid) [Pontibacillus sp. ALD_SL1]|uniref:hypothetical protein n=1 Tax=Pontibacillus sp. ALD_SL1 TaxID=2777185 RepID=UPI001A95C3F0|nr:hypothetical protein [Pontibacillus sp. ALD_SL1]QST02438.1 hypothetical protein IMZ31_23605 [Pontibacillus sp. ALD_SL1]